MGAAFACAAVSFALGVGAAESFKARQVGVASFLFILGALAFGGAVLCWSYRS